MIKHETAELSMQLYLGTSRVFQTESSNSPDDYKNKKKKEKKRRNWTMEKAYVPIILTPFYEETNLN